MFNKPPKKLLTDIELAEKREQNNVAFLKAVLQSWQDERVQQISSKVHRQQKNILWGLGGFVLSGAVAVGGLKYTFDNNPLPILRAEDKAEIYKKCSEEPAVPIGDCYNAHYNLRPDVQAAIDKGRPVMNAVAIAGGTAVLSFLFWGVSGIRSVQYSRQAMREAQHIARTDILGEGAKKATVTQIPKRDV